MQKNDTFDELGLYLGNNDSQQNEINDNAPTLTDIRDEM